VVYFLQQNPETAEHHEVREDGECVPAATKWQQHIDIVHLQLTETVLGSDASIRFADIKNS